MPSPRTTRPPTEPTAGSDPKRIRLLNPPALANQARVAVVVGAAVVARDADKLTVGRLKVGQVKVAAPQAVRILVPTAEAAAD